MIVKMSYVAPSDLDNITSRRNLKSGMCVVYAVCDFEWFVC